MAATGERPLMLSETGMDTIREGEEHQAELLAWQARAAFEIGLSGFIVFAFTDEWHTGGVEISDWAFGLVKKDRTPKRAFEAVGEIFRGALPPPLEDRAESIGDRARIQRGGDDRRVPRIIEDASLSRLRNDRHR